MDQIFDRLGTLLKSFLAGDESRPSAGRSGASGDPDLDDAMDELDAFLKDDREEQERLERRKRARAEEEAARSARGGAWSGGSKPSAGPRASDRLKGITRMLGLSFGAPLPDVKSAYKKLLKQHHPDRHSESPEAQRKATEYAARLNEAYDRIESWITTGKVPEISRAREDLR